MRWLEDAACRGKPNDWFYARFDRGRLANSRALAVGRSYCETCPVRTECLVYAVTAEERDGVWGGLEPDERAQIGGRREAARTGV